MNKALLCKPLPRVKQSIIIMILTKGEKQKSWANPFLTSIVAAVLFAFVTEDMGRAYFKHAATLADTDAYAKIVRIAVHRFAL